MASEATSQPAADSWSIYASCAELPLPVFIACLVSESPAGLVRSGNPPKDVLEQAWLAIRSEYAELIGGIQTSALIQRSRKANALLSRISRIEMLVETCRQSFDLQADSGLDGLIECFRQEGFGVLAARLATDDLAAYFKTLDAIIAKLRPDIIRLEEIAKEQDRVQGKQKDQRPTAREFDDMLFEISRFMKYEVRDDISVARYCTYVRKLQEYIKNLPKDYRDGR